MKRISYTLTAALCLLALASLSQNVSINPTGALPTDPKAMLEVRKPSYSKLKIGTEHYAADTSVLELNNRTVSNTGTAMFLSLVREEGLVVSTVSDIPSNTKDSLLSLKINGTMGFGVRNPAHTYHFHNPAGTNNLLSITSSNTGVFGGDGLIMGMSGGNAVINNLEGTNLRLGTGNLTRLAIDATGNVGVGTLTPAYKLDVNGDVNLSGLLRVNGSTGATGQVLTSNGASDPVWASAAYGNTTRFSLIGSEGATSSSNLNLSTVYNTNTTDVTVGASSITINKSGLYHIEGSGDFEASFSPSAANIPDMALTSVITPGASNILSLAYDRMRLDDGVTAYQRYFFFRTFTAEVYIPSGSTITFAPTLFAATTNLFLFNYTVRIRGHLISE